MLLSSIQVQGFKSFADKTILKFGKGITAVVGPNGSGKSNISDAVRWVLGEQSSKSLRGQSMEDVIFGGTDTRRPHGFCEVTLNIDNSDRTLNFDNDSVSVTRRYYRSHESEYLINNVSVRLKDVHELFMDTGLGRDGYSMIGQGKIDNIISSKSDERRDIFEEASGISKYRYRKTEAERKLLAAEDNLLRLKDIMDELESRVGPLSVQSEKAQKFLLLAEDKKKLEIGLWLYTLDNSKEALRNQESKISAAKLRYKEIEDSLGDFDKQVEQNTAEFTKYTSLIEQERTAISADNENIVKLESNITVIKNTITHNKDLENRLREEMSQLTLSDSQADEKIQATSALAEQKTLEIESLNEKLASLEHELSGLLTDSEGISLQIEEAIKSLNALAAKSADKRVSMVTADTSAEEISLRKDVIDTSILKAKDDIIGFENEISQTNDLLKKIEETTVSCSNSLKGYELLVSSKNENLEKLKKQSEEIRLDIEAKRRRLQILTELENNMEGFSHAVKSVISEGNKGILSGIHGTVSNLIGVDKKYSVAIETALGNNIQNIVVDTEADAKRAIAYLKKNNAGRATFLPIDSVKGKDFKNGDFDGAYGYIGIANELVRADDKYSQIIKSLLGGTVVTEDIDSAVSLAKKNGYRIKVVTLDGQVVNLGGSLTGGSLVKQAGILSRKTDITRISEDIDKLRIKFEQSEKDVLNASAALNATNADIVAVKSELTTANEDKIRALAELKRLEELLSASNDELSALNEEKQGSDEKLKLLKETSANAAKEIAQIENDKAALQLKIDEMTSGRTSISSKREAISSDITELKLKLIAADKDKTALLADIENCKAAVNDRMLRIKEIENEISSVLDKNKNLSADIKSAEEQIDTLRAEILKRNDNISSLMDKRNETEKAGVALRGEERDKTLLREQTGGEIARLTERKNVMMNEYDEVVRKLYDEYNLTKTEAEGVGIKIDKPAEAKKNLADIKTKIRSLGNVNVSAIEEYKEVKERYDFLKSQIDDVETSRKELHKLINQLTTQMKELFVLGFEKINTYFKKTFVSLFGGGEASIKLSDPDNILESGIDIEARLPGKNVPSLEGLSGGEKALVALSIYFAIMQVNPPPFCFLDEVDTALDDINVDRFADFMKQSGFPTQFICVTHRRGTMEAADMLYGVTMQEKGVTKLLELNVSELEKKLMTENQTA